MRRFAHSFRLRIVTAFILLMLRPSVIVLGAALLNDLSNNHASARYIGDDLEAHHLLAKRKVSADASSTKVHSPDAIFNVCCDNLSPSPSWGPLSSSLESTAQRQAYRSVGSRAPPV